MLEAKEYPQGLWRRHVNSQIETVYSRLYSMVDYLIMSPEQLHRFIQHYERITRRGLETLPAKADVVFELTDEQTIKGKL